MSFGKERATSEGLALRGHPHASVQLAKSASTCKDGGNDAPNMCMAPSNTSCPEVDEALDRLHESDQEQVDDVLQDASSTLSVWKSASISVEGVRWIIDGMSVASVVMDVPRSILWLCRDDTRSKRQDGTRSKAKVGSMPLCTCLPVGSGVVNDTRANALENAHPGSGVLEDTRENTLVMDGTRVKVPPFVMRGLAHSCRCMVLQRAARGVLG